MLNHSSADGIFEALGDATRRSLVEALCRGERSVSELAAPLDISLAAVVQHLEVLQKCGLVNTEKKGRVRTCRMNPRAFNELDRWLSQRRAEWNRHLDRLDEYLAQESKNKGKHK